MTVSIRSRVSAIAIVTVLFSGTPAMSQSTETIHSDCTRGEDRYERGLDRLDAITGGEGQKVVDALSRTSPDFARYVVEYPYGDVFCREGLTDQQRELATVAALTAMGTAEPELRMHIHGALNVGVSEKEIVETMILMSVYAGFPAAIHGLRAAEEVFDARGEGE